MSSASLMVPSASSSGDSAFEEELVAECEGETEAQLVRKRKRQSDDHHVQKAGVPSSTAKRQRKVDESEDFGVDNNETDFTHAEALPREIWMRIFLYLCAEDLLEVTKVCKYFNSVAEDNMLWHRLYKFRWSENNLGSKHFNESVHLIKWKQLYINNDKDSILSKCNGVEGSAGNPVLRSFKEMEISRRCETAPREFCPISFDGASNEQMEQSDSRSSVREMVALWRKRHRKSSTFHGVPQSSVPYCAGENCQWQTILCAKEIVFGCPKCGHIHICRDTECFSAAVEIDGVRVCKLSGMCLETRAIIEYEDDDPAQEKGEDTNLGRLGSAFMAGYFADDERSVFPSDH